MLYLAEVYTKNPATGENGWDIEMVWIKGAASRQQAKELLAVKLRNFDEVISLGEQSQIVPLGCKVKIISQ